MRDNDDVMGLDRGALLFGCFNDEFAEVVTVLD
jgi:hypothetical protein